MTRFFRTPREPFLRITDFVFFFTAKINTLNIKYFKSLNIFFSVTFTFRTAFFSNTCFPFYVFFLFDFVHFKRQTTINVGLFCLFRIIPPLVCFCLYFLEHRSFISKIFALFLMLSLATFINTTHNLITNLIAQSIPKILPFIRVTYIWTGGDR